jgi:outer membrane protein assembly factor BamA
MTKLCCLAVLGATMLAGCNGNDDDEKASQDLNVNSRYTVESVNVTGEHTVSISAPLRTELDSFIGARFDHSALEKVADRIKNELRVTDVVIKVERGNEPDHVIVNFQVARAAEHMFDVNVGKFVYDSREGWNGDGGATINLHGNSFSLGLVSDGDSMVERYAGVKASFERKKIGTDRLRVRFDFASFHDQWNPATLAAAPADEIYRSREMFSPMATVVILDPLELDFGVSFARLSVPGSTAVQSEGAVSPGAAKTESSNAVVSTLRYHRRWGSEHDINEQEVTGSYSVASATALLDTDHNFTRHTAKARYKYRHGHSTVESSFLAGRITGDAPIYERFELGDSTTLRGWNKFDLDPMGGSKVRYGSVDYGYRLFQVFYDTGAVWDRAPERVERQSIGVGFKKEGFQLAVAFPLLAGRADPIFYAGMNF